MGVVFAKPESYGAYIVALPTLAWRSARGERQRRVWTLIAKGFTNPVQGNVL